jgi:hypothetical protein
MTELEKLAEEAWKQWKQNAGLIENDKHIASNFTPNDMKSAVLDGAKAALESDAVRGLVEILESVCLDHKIIQELRKDGFSGYNHRTGDRAVEALAKFKELK